MSRKCIEPNFENASREDLMAAICAGKKETQVRCLAFLMLSVGAPRDQILIACKVTDRALRQWVSAFNKSGIDGLIVRKRTGRPKAIPPQTVEKLRSDIENPSMADRDSWSAKSFHGFIREKYQIECGYSTVLRLFHEMGYSLKIPRPWPDRQDEKKREEFKAQMRILCQDRDVELWFADESGIEGEPRPRRQWAPPGQRPTVVHNGDHIRLSALGMVCPRTGEFFAIEASHTDAVVFQAFLDEAAKSIAPSRKRNLLILDNASWHKVKKLDWHFFEPMYLPPYSPDLNPIECLWLLLKLRWFCNIHCKTKEALSDRICKALLDLINDPQQVAQTTSIHF